MKQETRTLGQFIDETYTHKLGYYGCRIHGFSDEYMNLHMTLLMMETATGNKNDIDLRRGAISVVEGFTHEDLQKEHDQYYTTGLALAFGETWFGE